MTVDGAEGTTATSSLQLLSATGKSRDKAQAMHLLWGADRGEYTPLIDDPRNDFMKGHANYPTTVLEAYSLMGILREFMIGVLGNARFFLGGLVKISRKLITAK